MTPRGPDIRDVPATVKVRAYAITLVAIPTCAAFTVAFAMLIVHQRRAHPVIGMGDYVGTVAGMLLMLALLGVSIRSWLRTRKVGTRAGEASWLARLVPALIVVGLLAGAWMGTRLAASGDETSHNLASLHCSDVLGYDAEPARRDSCIPIAIDCSDQAREAERVSGTHRSYSDRSADPTHACIRQRLGVPTP